MAKANAAKIRAVKKPARSKASGNGNVPCADGRAFVIEHREEWHDHFDLRLECDGVLKSWAVPNGPPDGGEAQSRLAVRMEDVPVREGEAEALWDQGIWEPASDPAKGFADGRIAFALLGDRVRGLFSLLRLRSDVGRKQGKENWLLRAERV